MESTLLICCVNVCALCIVLLCQCIFISVVKFWSCEIRILAVSTDDVSVHINTKENLKSNVNDAVIEDDNDCCVYALEFVIGLPCRPSIWTNRPSPFLGWTLYKVTKLGFSFFTVYFVIACFVLLVHVCFCCVTFSFCSSMIHDWWGRTFWNINHLSLSSFMPFMYASVVAKFIL